MKSWMGSGAAVLRIHTGIKSWAGYNKNHGKQK